MAHRESVQSADLKNYLEGESFFWNVSNPVGFTCRNKREDVLLVQFFLNRAFDDIRKAFGGPNDGVDVPANLVIDGNFGGKTWGALKWFQKATTQCVADGAVGSPDGTRFRTPKQGMIYTIYELNAWYRSCYAHMYQDIAMDNTCPTELKNQLYGSLKDLV